MAFNIYGRLSFEHVFTPSSSNGSEPVYSASILMPKGAPEVKKVEDEMMRVATEKWGAKGKDVLAKLVRENRVCLRDGSTKDYDGYDGMMFVSARNPSRPSVFNKKCEPITKEDGLIYSGCYVNARIEIWAQDNPKGGRRINCKLVGLQFAKDGDAFGSGSGPAKASDFEVIEDDEPSDDGKKPWE